MTNRIRSSRSTASILALAAGLALSACGDIGERAGRAQDLTGAALEQLGGGAGAVGPAGLGDVPVEARAFAGGLMGSARAVEPVAFSTASRRRPLFAIGSVICKPRDHDEPPAGEPAAGDLVQPTNFGPASAPPETEPDEETGTDGAAAEADGDRRPAGLPDPRRLRDRLPTPRQIERQTDARSRVLDVMTKYGLEGSVDTDREGQIILHLDPDADPTQFRPGDVDVPPPPARVPDMMAFEGQEMCPEVVDPDQMRRNPLLATECVIQELIDTGEFEYVEHDYIFQHQFERRPPVPAGMSSLSGGPDDPLWPLQWNFQSNGDGDGQAMGGAGFVDFWTDLEIQGSPEVTVAVVDTGLDMDHPDIALGANIAPGWDMVTDPGMGNDGDGRDPDPDDPGDLCGESDPLATDSYHGTHVAGTIGAASTNNRAGVSGGAWNVKIVPVRALGKCGGRLSDINDAIRWAGGVVPARAADGSEVWNDNPADVINLSIGLFQACPASLQDASDSVVERGVLVVSAAGNDRVPTSLYAPGGCRNVITVAAGDARGHIAPYSNYGPEVDILAPGGDLTRDDNGDGRPDGVLSTKLSGDCVDPVTNEAVAECYYAFEQGTSMAAPHVSAALALTKAAYPDRTAQELEALVMGALDPRTDAQCSGSCDLYIGAEPIEGTDNMCRRSCGRGLLNLGNLSGADTR